MNKLAELLGALARKPTLDPGRQVLGLVSVLGDERMLLEVRGGGRRGGGGGIGGRGRGGEGEGRTYQIGHMQHKQ